MPIAPDEHPVIDPGAAGAVLLVGGLVALFAAAAVEEQAATPQPVVIRVSDASRVEQGARAQAWQLSKAAYLAARRGDCAKVSVLASQIRDLDRDLHETVFVNDTAVRRCVLPDFTDEPGPATPARPLLLPVPGPTERPPPGTEGTDGPGLPPMR